MHSLPLLRSLTKEASWCVYPAAWRQRHVLPSALSGTTGRLPHPRQPRLAVLRNLARIVVGYNDHLREESYNHYIFGTGWNGVCARKRFAFPQFGGSVWESNSNPTFLTLGGS